MKKNLLILISLLTVQFASVAQCTISTSGSFPATTGYVAGQSFTATCSGVLNYVQFTANTVGTVPAGTLNVYAGNGTGTTPIYTQAFGAITIASIGSPIRVTLSGSLPVTSASQYTFAFFVNLDLLAGTGYAGGDAFQAGVSVSPLDVQFAADITAGTGINDLATELTSIYPNPATDLLTISSDAQIISAEVFTITGSVVKTELMNKTIDVSSLDKGMYLLKLKTDSGFTQSRFIKE